MAQLSNSSVEDYRQKLKQHSEQLTNMNATAFGSTAHVQTTMSALVFMAAFRRLPKSQQDRVLESEEAKASLRRLDRRRTISSIDYNI